jgi:hypothetical protein
MKSDKIVAVTVEFSGTVEIFASTAADQGNSLN